MRKKRNEEWKKAEGRNRTKRSLPFRKGCSKEQPFHKDFYRYLKDLLGEVYAYHGRPCGIDGLAVYGTESPDSCIPGSLGACRHDLVGILFIRDLLGKKALGKVPVLCHLDLIAVDSRGCLVGHLGLEALDILDADDGSSREMWLPFWALGSTMTSFAPEISFLLLMSILMQDHLALVPV